MQLITRQGQAWLPLFEQRRAALSNVGNLYTSLPAGQTLLADKVNKEPIVGDLSMVNGVFMSELPVRSMRSARSP